MLERLLDAIAVNDLAAVRGLLKQDPGLARQHMAEARLWETPPHWIYVGDTTLHVAAACHWPELTQALLDAGADANAATGHRRGAPLHYAADGIPGRDEARQVDTLRCLIVAGARIDAQDKNGASALHRAVRSRCAAAVAYLLEAGANPRVRNLSGSTPYDLTLHNTGRGGSGSAAAKEARETIRRLLA